ncbi:MAG: hypothetical protein ABI266_08550 [Ginsengibacter sp.]
MLYTFVLRVPAGFSDFRIINLKESTGNPDAIELQKNVWVLSGFSIFRIINLKESAGNPDAIELQKMYYFYDGDF